MRELLIIKPSSLGDIVHALQVAASIKAQQPEWRISWIVRDIFAPLMRSAEVVDEIFVFRRHGGVAAFLQMMREVRKREFDVLMDMQGLLRSGLMTSWARAQRKVGRSDAREGAGFFYQERVPLPPGERVHALEVLLQFCRAVGAEPELQGRLRFRGFDNLNFGFGGPQDRDRPILIFPDSRRPEKKWHGFAQLSSLIVRETGRRVIWAGNAYLPCREAFPDGRFLNLTGNTSLASLAALISRADWVISNDSGPMHLAAALGVKTLGIFGPTDPQLYGPYPLHSPTNFVIQAPVGDLKLLTVKEVFARFQRALGSAARRGISAAN
jgi:ADP-heptose:LPS heptosyltransferase